MPPSASADTFEGIPRLALANPVQVVSLVGDTHEHRSKAYGDCARHTVGSSYNPEHHTDAQTDSQQHQALAPHTLNEKVDRTKEKGQEITGQPDARPKRARAKDGVRLFFRRSRSVVIIEREPSLPNLRQSAAVLRYRHRSNLAMTDDILQCRRGSLSWIE